MSQKTNHNPPQKKMAGGPGYQIRGVRLKTIDNEHIRKCTCTSISMQSMPTRNSKQLILETATLPENAVCRKMEGNVETKLDYHGEEST
jgi:hypothetical protein